jgi:hypothetical protein
MLAVFAHSVNFADIGIQKRLVGFSANQCRETATAADPDGTIGIFLNGVNVHLGQDPISGEGVEPVRAIEIPERASVQSEPKSTTRAGSQAIDALAVPSGAVWDDEMSEIDGIKTHEAVLGSHPKIPVGSLSDGADAVEGQPVLTIPGLDIVFEDAPGRIKGKSVRQDQKYS